MKYHILLVKQDSESRWSHGTIISNNTAYTSRTSVPRAGEPSDLYLGIPRVNN